MRYHHIEGLKGTNNITFWQGHGATRTSYTLLMGMKTGAAA